MVVVRGGGLVTGQASLVAELRVLALRVGAWLDRAEGALRRARWPGAALLCLGVARAGFAQGFAAAAWVLAWLEAA